MPDFLSDHTETNDLASTGCKEAKVINSEVWLQKAFKTDPRHGCALLYRVYYVQLFSHALRFVYSKPVAEDIVAEIFCRFWEEGTFNRITTSYRAYLFKSVRHAAYNHVKLEFSRKVGLERFRPGESSQTDDILQYDELCQLLEETIDRLPPQCKRVFVLSRVEDRTYHDIASELGVSVKAIEKHVTKALRILRKKLDTHWSWL